MLSHKIPTEVIPPQNMICRGLLMLLSWMWMRFLFISRFLISTKNIFIPTFHNEFVLCKTILHSISFKIFQVTMNIAKNIKFYWWQNDYLIIIQRRCFESIFLYIFLRIRNRHLDKNFVMEKMIAIYWC